MFLHLGGDYSVRAGEVISIHDYEAMNKTETGKAFLQKRKKYIRDVSDGRLSLLRPVEHVKTGIVHTVCPPGADILCAAQGRDLSRHYRPRLQPL